MPSLSTYKRLYGSNGKTMGEVLKANSDMIMEATWDRDIQSKVCYLYDYYHDDEPDKNYNLHPENSRTKTPIDAKYIIASYKTMDKDQVPYHLQFKPSQRCNVDYYKEVFEERYDSQFPLGLFVDVPDNKGIYRRWLIVDFGYSYELQFDSWCILPCDYRFQWIFEGRKYQMWGVTRSQNS